MVMALEEKAFGIFKNSENEIELKSRSGHFQLQIRNSGRLR